jgi:hypothetical protein
MIYVEGETEAKDGSLFTYHQWWCPTCGNTIWDYDDEFEYPEDLK